MLKFSRHAKIKTACTMTPCTQYSRIGKVGGGVEKNTGDSLGRWRWKSLYHDRNLSYMGIYICQNVQLRFVHFKSQIYKCIV
jgi:hypothetical protein